MKSEVCTGTQPTCPVVVGDLSINAAMLSHFPFAKRNF